MAESAPGRPTIEEVGGYNVVGVGRRPVASGNNPRSNMRAKMLHATRRGVHFVSNGGPNALVRRRHLRPDQKP